MREARYRRVPHDGPYDWWFHGASVSHNYCVVGVVEEKVSGVFESWDLSFIELKPMPENGVDR